MFRNDLIFQFIREKFHCSLLQNMTKPTETGLRRTGLGKRERLILHLNPLISLEFFFL